MLVIISAGDIDRRHDHRNGDGDFEPNIRHSRQLQGYDVVSDGRVSDDIADPPGQQSIYIPPGDVRREAYRLSTFEQFPVTCPISRKSLAKSGFTFTGFYDRVKCFACGRTVERWEEKDNPAELKWHKSTCPFPSGGDSGNVPLPSLFGSVPAATPGVTSSSASQRQPNPTSQPEYLGEQVIEQLDPNTGQVIRRVRYPSDLPERIRLSGGTFEIGPNNQVIIRSGPGPAPQDPANVSIGSQSQPRRQWRMAKVISADHKRFLTNLFLGRELDRLTSFARWPAARPNISPPSLAKSGFFYLGDLDRTQCFSCGGVLRNWTLDDDAVAEHRTHFPQCRMVLGNEPRNIPIHEHPETEEEKEERYPCRFPSNPQMRSEQARLETFDRQWPMGRTAATPAELAQGGFFFLGERDRAKCWYCNGGLQNWEYDDIPWNEHAKWFPNCQFLLRVKGQHFVYRQLALNPQLARPIIARQDGSPLQAVGQPARGSGTQAPRTPPSEPRVRQQTLPRTVVDPQEEIRKRKERVQSIMRNSDLVRSVLAMGFDDKIVDALLEDKINSENEANPSDIYGSTGQLLDDVFKKEEEIRKAGEERGQASATAQPPLKITSAISWQDGSPLESVCQSEHGVKAQDENPSKLRVGITSTAGRHMQRTEDKMKTPIGNVLVITFGTESTNTANAEAAGTPGDEGDAQSVANASGVIAERSGDEERVEQRAMEMAASDPDHKSLCVVHQGKLFVVDTGSSRSFVPATEESRSRPGDLTFRAANGTEIRSYHRETVCIVDSDNRPYPFEFLVADVTEYILGMDFIRHYKLLVDVENCQLYNRHSNSFIPCELSNGQPVSAILLAESTEINELEEMVASICGHVQLSEQAVADENPAIIVDPSEVEVASKERVKAVMRSSDLVKNVLAMGFDEKIVAALLEDRINSGNVANPNDICESVGLLLDDVMKKEEEERRNEASAAATPNPSLSGPNSFRTMSSLYNGISSTSGMSSLGPSPGSGKYNVSYNDDEGEDERMDQDMCRIMEGTSASITSVMQSVQDVEEDAESLQKALNKIEEEKMCKICFTCGHVCCCVKCTRNLFAPSVTRKVNKAQRDSRE